MPAISTHGVQVGVFALQAREWRNTVGQSGMTPTAFAFLIPVFVVAVAAPFICVLCIRKRRHAVPLASPRVRKPALQRAVARERLTSVTDVSNVTSEPQPSRVETTEVKNGGAETRSVLDRECAVCLSTLHAPSPPEPAKVSDQPIAADAVKPPSIEDVAAAEPEQILKLRVCGHEFHAECLVSWFVLRKNSCPICRAVFLSKEEMQSLDDEAQPPVPTPATAEPATPMPVSNGRYFVHGHNVFSENGTRAPQQSTRMQRLMTRG